MVLAAAFLRVLPAPLIRNTSTSKQATTTTQDASAVLNPTPPCDAGARAQHGAATTKAFAAQTDARFNPSTKLSKAGRPPTAVQATRRARPLMVRKNDSAASVQVVLRPLRDHQVHLDSDRRSVAAWIASTTSSSLTDRPGVPGCSSSSPSRTHLFRCSQ